MRGCSRTSSRSPAGPCARRISPSRSPRWRAGSTPTRPGCGARAIADAALAALLAPVLADFASRFGRVRGGAMAVVAMGKAGGREMMAGSDLDLMLVYDHPEEVSESRGARQLPASQWFVRAAHAYVAAVTAPGVDGPLYDGRHAAAAVGQQGTGRGVARLVPALPRRGGMDLGAHGADPRPGDRRPAGTARAHRGGDRRGAGAAGDAGRRSAPMPLRCAPACCATCRPTARGM